MRYNFTHTKYACYASYITGAVGNNLPALLFSTFQKEFGISMSSLALLITLNFTTQMVVDFLGAKYSVKLGYRTCVVGANLFAFVGIAGLGIFPYMLPNPYIGIALATTLFAIGNGLLEVLISPIVEAMPGKQKASMMSILHSFYCWGHMATVLLATLYFVTIGIDNWRWLPMLWSIVPLLTAILYTRVPINVFGENENTLSITGLFKKKIFWVLALLMICSGAAEITMAQWASLFAETGLKVSKTLGDILGPCLFALCMGIARIFYGKKGSKIFLPKFLAGSGALCIVGYLVATLAPNPIVNLMGCGICGLSVGIMWPGVLSIAASNCPEGGTAMFALLALAGDVGCSAGPSTTAFFSEIFTIGGSSLKGGLITAIVFPILIVLVLRITWKSWKRA